MNEEDFLKAFESHIQTLLNDSNLRIEHKIFFSSLTGRLVKAVYRKTKSKLKTSCILKMSRMTVQKYLKQERA